MKIILAILIFSFIIIFHELGHFLFAKKCDVKVTEFCLGLGPTIFSWGKGETKYCLNILPFGGACVMEGEDGVNGVFIKDHDSDSIVNAVKKLNEDRILLRTLGKAARQTIFLQFSPRKYIEKLNLIYKGL